MVGAQLLPPGRCGQPGTQLTAPQEPERAAPGVHEEEREMRSRLVLGAELFQKGEVDSRLPGLNNAANSMILQNVNILSSLNKHRPRSIIEIDQGDTREH